MKKKLLSPTELKQLHAQQEEQKKILATQKLEEEKNKKLVSPKELLDPVEEPLPIVESVEVPEVPKDPIEVLRERIEELQYSIPEPKDYDEEIAYLEAVLSTKLNSSDLNLEPIQNRLYELKEEISNLPEVKYYDDEILALQEQLNSIEVRYYDEEISSLQQEINAIEIPEVKYYDKDIRDIHERLDLIKLSEENTFQKHESILNELKTLTKELTENLEQLYIPEEFDASELENHISTLQENVVEIKNELSSLPEVKYYENELTELSQMIENVRNSIPSIPEIKYYDTELQDLSSLIEEIRKSIPELPEVRYYENEISELEQKIVEVENKIPELPKLPEVKYYDKEITQLEDNVVSVKKSISELKKLVDGIEIPEQTDWSSDIQSIYREIEKLKEVPVLEESKDPLVPLDQKFATLDDLQEHYRLFINRVQQQLASIGGGGETRLEFLDDVDRNSAKTDGYVLSYQESTGKFIGVPMSGGGGGSGISTYADVAGIATYASTAGIATYSSTSGIATYASAAGIATYSPVSGIATYSSTSGISTYAITAGVATYSSTSGIASYSSISGISTYSSTSGIATYATNAGVSTYSTLSGIATYASVAGIATYSYSAGIATYATTAGVSTYSTSSGISTYSEASGIATYASIAGISTTSQGLTGTPSISVNSLTATNASFSGIVTASNSAVIKAGTATTALIVEGDARVIGILTIGTSSITLDGNINQVNVGSGVTLHHTNGVQVGGNTLHTSGLTLNHFNVSGISTISQLDITNGINVSGVVTATQFVGNLTGNSSTANYASTAGVSTYSLVSGISTYASTAGVSTYSETSGIATYASVSGISTYSPNAGIATYSGTSGIATYAATAGVSTYSETAGIATYASIAGISTYATSAGIATYSSVSGIATYASVAGLSTYSETSGIATYASLSGIATYATNAGVSTYASSAGISTYSETSGIATSAGTATTASYLTDAANIITGTINKDRISTTNALTVLGDLYVSNNISFGGTATQLNAQQLQIADADIVLGIGTSFSPTDNTANHGGVAVASTEGTPLVDLNIVPGETNPSTYKKIMWFKGDTIGTGLTDAWLFNYGVGIGSTQVPNGVRLAAGSVQFTQNDLSVVRNINASGIVTASSFIPSSGYIKAPDGTNSFYIYSGTGNVAFQGTIGASQINSASGYKAIDFGTTATPSVNVANNLIVGAGASIVGVVTASNSAVIKTGTATTALIVEGHARVTGILTIGTSSITLDGDINQVNVGSGVTLHHTNGVQVGGNTLHTSGLTLNHVNLSGITTLGTVKIASGIVTATSGVVTYYGDGQYLQNILSGVGVATAGGLVGTGATILDFRGAGISTVTVSAGIATINIVGGGGGGGAVSIGTQAPPTPTNGDLWYSPDYGRTFVWYDEVALGIGNTAVWVDAAPFNNTKEEELAPGKATNSFTASEGQSLFGVIYSVGYIDVYLNGIRLSDNEFIANNGSSITLIQPASSGDIIDVVQYTLGIGATGPQGPQGPLSQVVGITSSILHYPLIVSGVGSVTASITTTSNYFSFTPSSGTLSVNQLSVVGVATATDFNSTSDINLKENVKVIDNAVDKVNSISGITFNWKENKKPSAGVIAQQVEKVLPEIVQENDGNKTLNYNGLIGLLIEAVKEQQEEINNLKTRLERLEG